MRRWLLILGLLAVIALMGGALIGIVSPPDVITTEQVNQIQLGMTVPEVEKILGPPGVYMGARDYPVRAVVPAGMHVQKWRTRWCLVDVVFTNEDRVHSKLRIPIGGDLFSKVRRRFGL